MAQDSNSNNQQRRQQLPIDGDGVCMLCKQKPDADQQLTCSTCVTPWHVECILVLPETLASALHFECPDCSGGGFTGAPAPPPSSGAELVAKIREIEADLSLSEHQKAKKRQQLLSGKVDDDDDEEEEKEKKRKAKEEMDEVLALFSDSFKCSFCMQLPERPVTTPCGHNFCLKCFQKWIGQGKLECITCRSSIPHKMASQPRINSVLVVNIRQAKVSRSIANGGPPKFYSFVNNKNLPDEPFVTERAKRGGIANAKSGRIFVTVPSDHFGPISAKNDPVLNQGILVGQCFENRYKCRQWGVHRPLVCGISGQSNYGAQSVVLSGGYVDDEDHGEWFLYTGSGGRDLSGNKRTNKNQSFDQEFKNFNQALRVSCEKGYPVRVVRSHKEKRSSYAPEKDLRYDGIYRLEQCWLKVGQQGFKVCRYLFVRCDNEPAPWTSDEQGDLPRPLPVIPELQQAIDVFKRVESPSWDYDEVEACWKWKKPPPASKEKVTEVNPEVIERARKAFRKAQHNSMREQLLKGFSCLLCAKVLNLPVTTPCAHNFCKPCLEGAFAGQTFIRERTCQGGRKLRSQKNIMNCPVCPNDISDFLQNVQVNRELMGAIGKLQKKIDEDENENGIEDPGEKGSPSGEENSVDAAGSSEFMLSNAEADGRHEGALKRKTLDASSSSTEERTDKRTKTNETLDDSIGSPSSPLHICADDDLH